MVVLVERTNRRDRSAGGVEGRAMKTEASGASWVLPQGAEENIKTIAAEKILQDLLDRFRCPQTANHKEILNLVKAYPSLAKKTYQVNIGKQYKRDLSLLAAVCLLDPPLKLVQLIHGLHSQAIARTEGVQESLPLHYACRRSSFEVVRYLVEQYPQGIRARQRDGNLPIHLACRFKSKNEEVIFFLIETFPESCFSCCSKGWFPLHCAAEGRASLPTIVRLYEECPRISGYLNDRGWTPLHVACAQRGNSKVVKYLASSASHTLRIQDVYGHTPLFVAAQFQTVSVVRVLLDSIQSHPVSDANGRSILHVASVHNTASVVDLIATHFPEMIACRTTDYDRYTPLHEVCRYHDENKLDDALNIIRALVWHNRNLVLQRDREGRKPLYLARHNDASFHVIQYLIDLEI